MALSIIPPKFIHRAWNDGACVLGRACSRSAGEVTPDQLRLMLARGEYLLARAEADSGAVCWFALAVQQLPSLRALYIYAAAGPGATGPEVAQALRDLARAEGCSVIRGACHGAMGRIWRRHLGGAPVYTIYESEA